MFGRDIVEVATFRGHHQESSQSQNIAAQSEAGMLLRDNVYGTIDEDAERRDFTINAMYYNIADYSIHDYAGGMEDLEDRLVRLIGDPETRYREDPVRMLRAVRLRSNSILISKKIPRRRLSNLRHCCVTSLRLVSTKNRSKCCKRVMV